MSSIRYFDENFLCIYHIPNVHYMPVHLIVIIIIHEEYELRSSPIFCSQKSFTSLLRGQVSSACKPAAKIIFFIVIYWSFQRRDGNTKIKKNDVHRIPVEKHIRALNSRLACTASKNLYFVRCTTQTYACLQGAECKGISASEKCISNLSRPHEVCVQWPDSDSINTVLQLRTSIFTGIMSFYIP
jgi:hypothetical protein